MESKSNQPPLVVVVGETASGKSSLGLTLAERFNGEIICADSWTVRRGVNIGTAKPSPEDQARVPHHLLDVVDPCTDFSAAVFKRMANEAIADIASKGKVPIMVGGTGLYVDSVLFDFGFLPPADPSQREAFNAMTIPQLLARITEQGLALDDVDTRNKRRLIRLLETGGARPTWRPMRANTLLLGITLPRGELSQRVVQRVDLMFQQGLKREVKQLADMYGWECEALKGIGYQEWRGYFEGTQNLEQIKQRIIKNTTDLAKRQRTWFKRHKSIQWICKTEEAVDFVTTFLNK